jgi:hypothetical protein
MIRNWTPQQQRRSRSHWRRYLWLIVLSLFPFLSALGGWPHQDGGAASRLEDQNSRQLAAEILQQARERVGTDPVRNGQRTFSARGKSRRYVRYLSVQSPTRVVEKQKVLSGKLEMDFALPDRFWLRIRGATLTGFGFSIEEIVNGEKAWRNPPMSVRSFQRDQRVIDVGDVERTLLMQARTARQQIAFHSLGWLATSPSSLPLELRYAGQSRPTAGPLQRMDGLAYQTVLASSDDGLRITLYFDPESHLLTAINLAYVDVYREAVVVEVASFDRRVIAGSYARAREERRLRQRLAERQEVTWRFFDHRAVTGLLIPHRATIHFNGTLIEEVELDRVRVDEPINPRRFAGQEEVRY